LKGAHDIIKILMGMKQIVTSPNETNAALIKGFLANHGIQASYAPNTGVKGHTAYCTVYCEDTRSEEALKLLNEQGLIGK